ncbi:MAG: polysaccharide export protein, partial [Gelidibacter sp.]
MKHILLLITALFILNSCATKKEILYFQDSDQYNNTAINYTKPTLQPNDILKITVGALVEETAIPYNRTAQGGNQST